MFVGCVSMFFTWTPTFDILLYVVPPTCRATAETIITVHIFRDAFSPLIVGAISDAYTQKDLDPSIKHLGLLYSFYITLVILCIGSGCYFITACYLCADRENIGLLTEFDEDMEQMNEVPVVGWDDCTGFDASLVDDLMVDTADHEESANTNLGYYN